MPVPQDFKLSQNNTFSFDVLIEDINPNYSDKVTYANGTSYPKGKGQTFIDLSLKIVDGEHAGKQFKEENVNTGVYKSSKGKSAMYVILEATGVDSDTLDKIAEQKTDINLNDLIGKTIVGLTKRAREEKGGHFYLDTRDQDKIKEKTEASASVGSDFDNAEKDNSDMVEDVLNGDKTTSDNLFNA